MSVVLRSQGSLPALLALCVAMSISSRAQTLTTLFNFNGTNGAFPLAGLVQGSDGNFYGTTSVGGSNGPFGPGTVFKVTPDGTLTTLHSFNGNDGNQPQVPLVLATDGNFYGTTWQGGAAGNNCDSSTCGTIFKITASGTFTLLHSFTGGTDGRYPGQLIQASDGNFYGTAWGGGNDNCETTGGCGLVFKITPQGDFTKIFQFDGSTLDGLGPEGLVQGTDGNFYGMAQSWSVVRCSSLCGSVFKLTPGGNLTTLHWFNGQDGNYPSGQLLQGTDGNFYGTTSEGGAYFQGTVFKMTPSGALTSLYSFCSDQDNCSDGANPESGVIQAADGSFYGTASNGGIYGYEPTGTIFKVSPSGSLTTIFNFNGASNGGTPIAGLLQATNGTFYGATSGAGANNDGTVFSFSGPNPTAAQFVPVTPCRLADTRQTKTPIQSGTFQFFIVPELGNCNIPATASAYSLNVTVGPHQPLGYLTIWPAGRPQPNVSTMNSPDGRTKANAAIVPAGASAAVSVYATDTTDVILDIDGYFTVPSSQTYEFYPLTPCRVVDTRAGSGFPPALGPPSLVAQQQRDLPILSSSCLNGITNPLAYSFNVTVVPNPSGQPLGYLTVWPSNQTQPYVSTLNNPTATVVANAAVVPAAPDGDIDVYAYNSTDLIIDINGYFAAPGQTGLSLYPVAPCRVLDTRNNNGKPFMDEKTVNVAGSPCAPPSSAQAYVFNATVVPPGSMPYLTLWADGQPQPVVSTLNAYDGFITSNMAIVPTTNGSIDAYAAGLTQLILDISGYFAP